MGSMDESGAGGGGVSLPTAVEGGILQYVDGAWSCLTDADLQANSGVFGEGVEAQTASVTDNILASDPVSGNAIEIDPNDGITANANQITPDMIAGIAAATTLDAENPVATVADISGGTTPLEAFTPQGRLEVWPGYCELTNDVGVQLNATTDLAQFRWVQKTHYYGPLLPFSWYCDAVGAAGDVTWTLYAVEDAGTLTSLDSATTAISSTGWKRETGFAVNVNLVAGRSYALVVSVSAGDDISLSCNRNNTSTTSALPDDVTCYISTDGGTNWTACLKDTYYPAVLNVQLNTTAAHEPYLHYGRYVGQYAPCMNAAGTEWFLGEIPAAGLNIDVSDLTADTLTHIFLKEAATAGTLALEASQSVTTWTQVNGRTHAGTNSEKLHIGDIAPTTLGSTLVGPMDVCQQRLVANVFNQRPVFFGKLCPYVGVTSYSATGAAWKQFNNTSDYSCGAVIVTPQTIRVSVNPHISAKNATYGRIAIWFAAGSPPSDLRGSGVKPYRVGFYTALTCTEVSQTYVALKGKLVVSPWQLDLQIHYCYVNDAAPSENLATDLDSCLWC